MDEAERLSAYLLYYWPSSFVQIGAALRELGFLGSSPRADLAANDSPVADLPAGDSGRAFLSALDIGSGPGPGSIALAQAGFSRVVALDQSRAALSCVRRLGDLLGPSLFPRAALETHPWAYPQPLPELGAESFDLILLSHFINEVGQGSPDPTLARKAFIRSLEPLLAPGGIILIIEPSLLKTSRELLALRDTLIKDGYSVVAPCPFKGPCPALAAGPAQTCHFSAAWRAPAGVEALARAAGLDRSELKMSWVALSRQPASSPDPGLYRVVSEPMLNKAGKTRYFFCGAEGRITVSARLAGLAPACVDFSRLKRGDRVRLGGLVPPEAGGAFGLNPASFVEIIDF
jgi:SAM-dependent methyltransferase